MTREQAKKLMRILDRRQELDDLIRKDRENIEIRHAIRRETQEIIDTWKRDGIFFDELS